MEERGKLLAEYKNKKQKIQERLGDFEKFYNEPRSWFYSSGEMRLLPVRTKDDHRIFEELAFCIFTANTSAEMGAKAVDSVRSVLINGSAEEMTRRLEGVYRFNNVRPAYIIHSRNYLKNTLSFRLKDKISAFKNKSELRDFFALNKDIKGLGYKESSHFLRNIGLSNNQIAILDRHILRNLYELNLIKEQKVKSKRNYLETEKIFLWNQGMHSDPMQKRNRRPSP